MNPIFFLLIPVLFSVLHYRTGKYLFSALVTLSCLAVVFLYSDIWIPAAYAFSVVGDYFMAHSGGKDGDRMLLGGITGFFAAHLCFLGSGISRAWPAGRMLLWLIPAAVLAAGYAVFLSRSLIPRIPKGALRPAVVVYAGISLIVFTVSLLSSARPLPKFLFSFGLAMILFSDTLIALSRFLKVKKPGKLICPTYFACHILVAASVLAEAGFIG